MIYLVNFIRSEILILLFIGLLFATWIWAIVDIVKSEFRGENDKVLFLILVLLLPFVGTIIYFIVGRPKQINSDYS